MKYSLNAKLVLRDDQMNGTLWKLGFQFVSTKLQFSMQERPLQRRRETEQCIEGAGRK